MYTLELKTTGKLGGTLVFVKYRTDCDGQKAENIRRFTGGDDKRKSKYIDKVAKMEKVNNLPLHLADDETLAVFAGRNSS